MHLLKRNSPACSMNHDTVTTEKMGNVLVIGNSGVGKSTLIKGACAEDVPMVGRARCGAD